MLVGSYSLQCSRENRLSPASVSSGSANLLVSLTCSFLILSPAPSHLVCSCMCLYHRPFSHKDQSRCIRAHSNLKVFVTTPYPEKKNIFSGIRSWDRSTNFLDDQSKIVMCRLHQFTEAATMAYELHLPYARLLVVCVVAITQHSIKPTSRKEGWFLLTEDAVLPVRDVMVTRAGSSWSYCVCSQKAERQVNDGADHALPFLSVLDSHPWNRAIFTASLSTSIYSQNALTHMSTSLFPLWFYSRFC